MVVTDPVSFSEQLRRDGADKAFLQAVGVQQASCLAHRQHWLLPSPRPQVIQQALHRQPSTAAQYLQQMYAAQQQHLMLQTAALQQQHLGSAQLQSLAAVQQVGTPGAPPVPPGAAVVAKQEGKKQALPKCTPCILSLDPHRTP